MIDRFWWGFVLLVLIEGGLYLLAVFDPAARFWTGMMIAGTGIAFMIGERAGRVHAAAEVVGAK